MAGEDERVCAQGQGAARRWLPGGGGGGGAHRLCLAPRTMGHGLMRHALAAQPATCRLSKPRLDGLHACVRWQWQMRVGIRTPSLCGVVLCSEGDVAGHACMRMCMCRTTLCARCWAARARCLASTASSSGSRATASALPSTRPSRCGHGMRVHACTSAGMCPSCRPGIRLLGGCGCGPIDRSIACLSDWFGTWLPSLMV